VRLPLFAGDNVTHKFVALTLADIGSSCLRSQAGGQMWSGWWITPQA
jgi:hypothetical protein